MRRRALPFIAFLAATSSRALAEETPSTRGGANEALVRPAAPTEAAPAPQKLAITPPKLLRDPGVSYPSEALAEGYFETTTVQLKVDVDANGDVTKVEVETPRGHGFDEAATAAAMELKYEPAKKGDRAIASRWRHVYTFDVPRARLEGTVRTGVNDRPLVGVTVRLEREGADTLLVVTDATGRFDFGSQTRGPIHVTAMLDGFDDVTVDDTLVPAQETSLTLRLERTPPKAVKANDGSEGPRFEEVTVRGQRPPREVTKRTLEKRELERIPGTNGDALRALQSLPGVARPPGLAGLLIVRGAAPNSTNVFVDGTLIPIVYHFGGLSSVVPTELISKIDFYPGNFSARYGRVNGGIVDVGLRAPRVDKLSGMAQVDLIDARGVVEGPIGDSGWSFALGARRSYVDVWLKPVLEAAGSGVTTAPVYYDWQAVVERPLPDKGRFNLAFYGSDDRLELLIKSVNGRDPSIGGGLGLHTAFWRIAATYKQPLGPKTELSMVNAFGQNTIEFNLGDNAFKLDGLPLTNRVDLTHKITPGTTLDVGLDMLWQPYDIFVRLPQQPRPGEPVDGPGLSREPRTVRESSEVYRPAAFAELELLPAPGTRIVPGVRLDYARDTKSWDVSPRFSARHEINREYPKTTVKGGAGLFAQPPQPQETNAVFGTPGVTSNRAYGYSLGVEQDLAPRIEGSLEGFYKRLDNLVVAKYGNPGVGAAYGLELLVRYRPDDKFFGWLAYTLSRSAQQDRPGEPERLAQFDQTHILTALGSWRLGGGWEIGGRMRVVSGSNTTPNTYGFFDGNSAVNLPAQGYPPFNERLPLFHQLDIRVDRTWTYSTHKIDAYLDLQNAYNSPNSDGVSYNYNYTKRSYASSLPILPSIGARIDF
jgi:TonB family protein